MTSNKQKIPNFRAKIDEEKGTTARAHDHDDDATPSRAQDGNSRPPLVPPVPPVPPAAEIAVPPEQVKAEVKNILQAVANPEELNLDDDEDEMLRLLLYRGGGAKYGIGACETYLWQNPRLMPVGSWVDPDILVNAAESNRELVSHPDPAVANVGLVGALWSHEANMSNEVSKRKLQKSLKKQPSLQWRDIRSIIEDPYQSHSARLEALYALGLTQACGITFNMFGICGIVVWYAKAGINQKVLRDPAHETYLRRVSHFKGALLAILQARRNCVELLEQSAELNQSIRSEATSPHSASFTERVRFAFKPDNLRKSIIAWLRKIRGGGAQLPRCMSWGETIWTFIGSFLGLLVIAFLHRAVELLSDSEYVLILGPFAAITMLQYAMLGAPAAQPRTIFWGQVIAALSSIPFTYIPEHVLPRWLRMIVAPTFAISVMMKVGTPCPPAAANSLIYVQFEHNWRMFGLTMLCSSISFFPAIAYNNLNPRRQYPTYWGHLTEKLTQWKIHHVKKKEQRSSDIEEERFEGRYGDESLTRNVTDSNL